MTARGGSNYNWTHVDCCNREPYGVLKDYTNELKPPFGNKRNLVRAQLKQLYASGQRRLRIMVYHAPEGQGTGTVLVPSDPIEEWLGAFLADIKAAGFEEIMVAMGPQGEMDIGFHWGMTKRVRGVVAESGIHYRMDLVNEGVVPKGHKKFVLHQAIWNEFRRNGKADTVGFSIPLDHRLADRIASLDELYSGDMPYLFSVHSYGYAGDEHLELRWLDDLLNEHGHKQGIIIGECHYDDIEAAVNIDRARATLSRPIFYLCQWPMNRHGLCKHVDVAPPVEFGEYIEKGF